MTQPKPTVEETELWQRRLASQANNRAWSLSEKPGRSDDESEEMLHAAHAARHLWSLVGNENNKAHAEQLLAHVYALRNDAQNAATYAKRSGAYFLHAQREAWELALAHAVLANVSAVCRKPAEHALHYNKAAELMNALADPQDREILLATFRVVPAPA